MTTVCMVRHAQSEWNLQGRVQGHRDPDLSPDGRRQAQCVAGRLAGTSWDAVYASDLTRAARTAWLVARVLGLPVLAEPDLRERGQGRLEGMTAAEALHAYPDFDAPEVGREPAEAFRRRCHAALARILAAHPAGRVLVVTHGGVIRLFRGGARPPANGSISVLAADGRWQSYDDTAHLAPADVTRPEDPTLARLMDLG